MPSRRSHRKSRHGCTQCKLRKVKCDEEPTGCSNCLRRGDHCNFENFNVSPSKTTGLPVSPNSKNGDDFFNGPAVVDALHDAKATSQSSAKLLPALLEPKNSLNSPLSSSLNITDLQLMHHYTAVTSLSISKLPTGKEIWQHSMIQEGLGHDFLMHGLLALTAVHLIYLTKDYYKWRDIAKRHQDLGLSLFIPALNDINAKNCHALFGFSCVLTFLAVASPLSAVTGSHIAPIDKTVGFVVLLRGVRAVVRLDWVANGSLGHFLHEHIDTRPRGNLTHEMSELFSRLREKIVTSTPDDDPSRHHHRASYLEALTGLEQLFDSNNGSPIDANYIMAWPICFDEGYLQLLKERQPLALAVLAYYGVLVHQLNDFWWGLGWGRQLTEAIAQELGNEWQPTIQWALDKVRNTGESGNKSLVVVAKDVRLPRPLPSISLLSGDMEGGTELAARGASLAPVVRDSSQPPTP